MNIKRFIFIFLMLISCEKYVFDGTAVNFKEGILKLELSINNSTISVAFDDTNQATVYLPNYFPSSFNPTIKTLSLSQFGTSPIQEGSSLTVNENKSTLSVSINSDTVDYTITYHIVNDESVFGTLNTAGADKIINLNSRFFAIKKIPLICDPADQNQTAFFSEFSFELNDRIESIETKAHTSPESYFEKTIFGDATLRRATSLTFLKIARTDSLFFQKESFSGCKSLTSVIITPDIGHTTIGKNAFLNCKKLTVRIETSPNNISITPLAFGSLSRNTVIKSILVNPSYLNQFKTSYPWDYYRSIITSY